MPAIRIVSVMPPVFDRSGWTKLTALVLDQPGELETGEMIFAGGERHGAELAPPLIGTVVLGRERLFQPADPQFLIGRHHPTDVVEPVAGVGVDQDLDLVADSLAHRGGPGDVGAWIVADAQLDRPVTPGDVAARLLRQRTRAPANPARCRRHRPDRLRGAAEQLVERPARRLGADVPQGEVEAAQRHRGGIAHAVAGQLHLIDPLPDADDIDRIHADDEFADRGVDQLGDRARAAPVMGLAPADDAFVGLDLHQHGVAFDRAADAEPDILALRHRDRRSGRTGCELMRMAFLTLPCSRG